MSSALNDYLQSMSRAESQAGMISLLEGKIADLGYDRIAFAEITSGRHNKPETPALILSYPQDWVDHYFQNNYQHIDPATSHAKVAGHAFRWDELPARLSLSAKQKKLINESEDAGLHGGLSVPLYDPGDCVSVVAMASSDIHSVREHVDLPTMATIAAIFCANYTCFAAPMRCRLVAELLAACLEYGLARNIREYIIVAPRTVMRTYKLIGCAVEALGSPRLIGGVELSAAACRVGEDVLDSVRKRANMQAPVLRLGPKEMLKRAA